MDTIHIICSKPEEEVLLECVRENDRPKIQEIVARNPELLKYVYGSPFEGKTIIHIVCSSLSWEVEPDLQYLARLPKNLNLIKLGANLYEQSYNLHERKQAIHFAALSLNPWLLEIICQHLQPRERNSETRYGVTALLLITRDCDCESRNAIECVKVLLAHKVDVNKTDRRNLSPIWYAAERGYRKVVALLLENPNTDIDTHIYESHTARDLIIKHKLYDNKKLPPKKNIFSPLWSWMRQLSEKGCGGDVQNTGGIDCPEETDSIIVMEKIEPEEQLLNYVRCNEGSKIRELVASNPKLLEYVYGLPFKGKTITHIVCSSLSWEVEPNTVETLIELGVNLYQCSKWDEGKQAIHFAALSLNSELLKIICKHLEPAKIDSTVTGGDTALLLILKYSDCESRNAIECVKVLLDYKADVNKADGINRNPISWAVWRGYRKIIDLLLENPNTDIDTPQTYEGKTVRDLIIQYNLCDKNKIGERSMPSKSFLLREVFQILRERREDDFLKLEITSDLVNKSDNGETMLEICARLNLPRCTRRLVKHMADIESRTLEEWDSPLKIAAKNGHYEVFKEMCVNLEEIPYFLLRLDRDYQMKLNKCLELLLKMKKSLVNKKDLIGQTPLQFASRHTNNGAILILLRNGASLGDAGYKGRLPVVDIGIETLEEHFNNCITSDWDKIDDENLLVTFDYETLLPSDIEARIVDNGDEKSDHSGRNNAETYSEIDVIAHISKNKKLHPLLTHPLITSFIHIKWERIKYFLYANLLLYVTAWLSFIVYALIYYKDHDYQRGTNGLEISVLVILWITFSFFIVKEIFQLVVSPLFYVKKIDNLFEIAFICSIAFILCYPGDDENIKKQISAIAILASSFQLVLLIGHLPKMSTYIEMLRTVSYSFFKLLLWNAIPILAFSLSFYTLFRETTRSDNSTDCNEENDAFDGVGVSLFKTFVMMTGEFDASNINFSNVPISWFIFVFFIFMIVIVLSNLMNGLAVSDTQEIKSNAKILAYISRVDHICYIENMLLGNLTIIPSKLFKLCRLPSLDFKISLPRKLSELAFLFPNYLECSKMKVYLKMKGKIDLRKKDVRLDKETLKNVRILLMDRKRLDKMDDSMQKKLETVDESTKKLETKVESVQKKLEDVDDSMQKKLETVNNSLQKKLETSIGTLQKRLESVEEQQKLMLDNMNAISQNINKILEKFN